MTFFLLYHNRLACTLPGEILYTYWRIPVHSFWRISVCFIILLTKIYSDWRDEKYHNENNYNSQGIFSWYADGASHAIFSENAGSITSVWAYDPTTNKTDVIWKDNVNCPIWIEYFISDQYIKE